MPYTHSLLGVLCWSALAYVVRHMIPSLRGARTGMILAAAVFSHWILDLIRIVLISLFYDSVGRMGIGIVELSRSGVRGGGCLVPRGGDAISHCGA